MKPRVVGIAAAVSIVAAAAVVLVLAFDGAGGWLSSARRAAPEEAAGGGDPEDAASRESGVVGAVPMTGFAADAAGDHGPADGVLVHVVEKGNGKRLGGAEVTFLDQAVIERATLHEALLSGGRDLEALLRRFGRRYLADPNGEVRLPRFQEQAGILARHGALSNLLELRAGLDDPILVELEPTTSARVQTVGEDGAPLSGVPVSLRVLDGDLPLDVWRGTTEAPDGIAEILHVGKLVSQLARPGGATLLVTLGFPLAHAVEAPLDPAALPAEPVRLVVPPAGRVAVRVSDPAGAPVRAGALVSLRAVVPGEEDRGSLYGALLHHPARVEDGVAAFPFVGIGLRLQAEAWMGDRLRPVVTELSGPAAAGEEATCALSFRETYPALVGRACDETGAILRSCTLHATLQGCGGRAAVIASGPLRTNEEGHFRFVVRADATGFDRLELELALLEPGTRRVRLAGLAGVPRSIGGGEVDLGTLHLLVVPVVATGSVVDDLGRAVRGATVIAAPAGGSDEPADEIELRGVTDAAGRFALNGRITGGELRIRASRDQDVSAAALLVPAGSTGIRIVLPRGGAIAGALVLDPEIRASDLEIALRGGAGGASLAPVEPAADGSFELRGLAAGTHDLVVRGRDDVVPIAAVDGVAVRAGQVTRDPRVAALDLRGRVRALTLTVTDRFGRPVADARARLESPGRAKADVAEAPAAGARPAPWRRASGNLIRLLVREPAVDLVVEAPRFRPARLRSAGSEERVVLTEAILVRLVFARELALPANARLVATLVPRREGGGDDLPLSGAAGEPCVLEADAGGEAELAVPAPGRYRVLWAVRLARSGPGPAVGLPAAHASLIEVVETAGPQRVPVDLDPGVIAEALKAMGR